MKRLVAATAFFLVTSAQAGTITGFTGDYDVANWTTAFTDPCTSCYTIATPTELTLGGAKGEEALDQFTDRTITVPTEAVIRFDWRYVTDDDPFFDPFGIIYNDGSGIIFTPLSDDLGGSPQTGFQSFVVDAGDIFGFRVWSLDSLNEASTAIIFNFSVETVPEPGSLALFSIAVLAAAAVRRRRFVA